MEDMDHPRSRGVHLHAGGAGDMKTGSSPLARGPLAALPKAEERLGIIPARAGSTVDHLRHHGAGKDHPRSRGVHASGYFCIRKMIGSSPLARGPPAPTEHTGPPHWIIPARAGSTRCRGGLSAHRQDHPRSRGVHHLVLAASNPYAGSSPLARGPLFVPFPSC